MERAGADLRPEPFPSAREPAMLPPGTESPHGGAETQPGRAPSTQPARLRVAVVGVGHLGRIHARIWAADPAAELVAVLDRDAVRAREAASALGCQVVAAPGDLPGLVDAVCVATPADQHALVAIPLLERGLACLIEKPLATDRASAAAILNAAERGGAFLSVGHSERFQPTLLRFRELGLLPLRLEFERLVPAGPRGREVGVVHDLMIHDLDLAMELFGAEPLDLEVLPQASNPRDQAAVRLYFSGGRQAELRASRAGALGRRRCRLEGADFRAEMDFVASELWFEGARGLGRRLEALQKERSLQAELADFRERLLGGGLPAVSGQAGLRAVLWADAVAAQIGAPPGERCAV